jgi:hypothetical protein
MNRLAWYLAETLLAAAIFCASLWAFGRAVAVAAPSGDEAHTVWATRYFALLFLKRDVTDLEWGDRYWTHTQPPLARYLIGAWLHARGVDLSVMLLPGRYDWSLSFDENRRRGQAPDGPLLAEARRPMVGAAAAVTLLYTLGRFLSGPLAGAVAAFLMLESPLLRQYLVQARSEALMLACILLALLLGCRFAPWRRPSTIQVGDRGRSRPGSGGRSQAHRGAQSGSGARLGTARGRPCHRQAR